MISRTSALLLGYSFREKFGGSYIIPTVGGKQKRIYELKRTELYDFFYAENYELWFLSLIQVLQHDERSLVELIGGIHAGLVVEPAVKNSAVEQRQEYGQRFLKRLAESILNSPCVANRGVSKIPIPSLAKMKAQLELDGYIFDDGKLFYADSDVVNATSESTFLALLLSRVGFNDPKVVKHHMERAEENYRNDHWDECISNARKFHESILFQSEDRCEQEVQSESKSRSKPNMYDTRLRLVKLGLINEPECEALAKLYALLSAYGGHSYIASKEQARLLWNLSLHWSQFVLHKVELLLKNREKNVPLG